MQPEANQFTFLLFSGAFLAVLMGTFVVAMVVLHRQRQIQNRERIEKLKTEYEKTLLNIENEIQQDTLSHVGRELHDNIGQLLSLAKLYLNSSKPEKQAEGKEYLNQIIQEVRGLSKTLNLDWVESVRLEEFIGQQLEKIKSTGHCETKLETIESFGSFPKDQKLVLIRVIQECLNNTLKHANPNLIEIKLIEEQGARKIQIIDDGKGFDTKQESKGSGMFNLKKRMETIGGKFSLSSEVGKGTFIELELPN
ncbi:histidine kinase/DNA gyrase B/HSP90-like ATPase [Algoriphagus boseongensis]|uniref:histidine kinase n=1 Tax=Algoriphagus boseongensis TaxID=1442587 RepID=A0A4R6T7Q7_9BACT|nr:ATP-binding protein [Algoriphagus boseongensis]TDQ17275.1 histidine kinase/DNA gyrase B/HSP90-like ATPase [Algoriphagus boseongensis]